MNSYCLCKEPLGGFFKRKRICLVCHNAVCENCFVEDHTSNRIIGKKGYCLNCFGLIQVGGNAHNAKSSSMQELPKNEEVYSI